MSITNDKKAILDVLASNYPAADLSNIDKACAMATEKMKGQKRGQLDYVTHLLETALLVAEMKLDISSVVAAILHDVPHHCDYTIADIERDFGREVAGLLEGIENISQIDRRYRGSQRYVVNARRMFIALAKDFRVLIIKFAERLNNLQHVDSFAPTRQRNMIEVTERVYIPLAGILGIWQIRAQLEDICFRYRQPLLYEKITKKIARGVGTLQQKRQIRHLEERVRDELTKAGIAATVSGRFKNISAIHQKMTNSQKRFHEIYDVFAVRIIVTTLSDCYVALGLIHQLWRPVKERIKDYIAQPKPNGYQSLHTTVVSSDGYPVEFQIRTGEMHDVAQYGVAAHWYYKGIPGKPSESWIANLMRHRQDYEADRTLAGDVPLELLTDRIFVYSPKGDIIELPKGATPVDFAYLIHSDLGNHCTAARVNGQPQPLSYQLHNNDVVEIITRRSKHPAKSWLRFLKTNEAKIKVRRFVRRHKPS